MNIQPLADRVLVLPAQAEEKVGGIINLIPQRKSRCREPLSLRARGRKTRRCCLRRATKFFMENILVQNWSMRVKNT